MARWGKTEVGYLFQQFRMVNGVTQHQLARKLFTSDNYIWMIEAGKALPSLDLLDSFCRWAGFNVNIAKRFLLKDKVSAYQKRVQKKLGITGVM